MEFWLTLEEIVGVLGLSLLAGIFFQRIGHPALIGYLLIGLLFGPFGLGIIKDDIASKTSEIGIVLLLFLLGLEFSPKRLKSFGIKPYLEGLFQISLTVIISIFVFHFVMHKNINESWIIGSAIALSSTAAVLKFLIDRGEIDSQHGRIAVGILLVQDIAVIILLIILNSVSASASVVSLILSFGITLLKTCLLIITIWLSFYLISRFILSHRGFYQTREHLVILAIIIALGSALLAHRFGLSATLGSFIAGLLIAENRIAHQLKGDIVPIQSIFLVIFFTSIGMMADLNWFIKNFWDTILFILTILVIKLTIIFLIVLFFRRNFKSSFLSTFCLLSVSEFAFVVASIGKDKQIIEYDVFELIIISIVITMIIFPYAFRFAEMIVNRLHKKLKSVFDESHVIHNGEEMDLEGHYIIVGYGPVGKKVVDALDNVGAEIVIIDLNPFHSPYIKETHFFIFGDMTSADLLQMAGIKKAKAIIITTPDMKSLLTGIAIIRSLNHEIIIICRSVFSFYIPELLKVGADIVIDSEAIQGDEMAEKLIETLDISNE
jgi:CPA2 family monovalent cation:H+ antiporter-2